MTPSRRMEIAEYLASGRHVEVSTDAGRPIRDIARDLKISETTLRRWLKLNHRDVWERYWNRLLS
jgi:transposase-like protein